MKTVCTFMLISLVLIQSSYAQTGELKDAQEESSAWDDGIPARFNIGGGLFIPQGRLGDFIATSPLVEAELHIPAYRNHAFDLVVQLVVPNQSQDYVLQTPTGIFESQTFFISNYFMRFNKNLLSEEGKQRFEIGLGLGASTLVTEVKNPSLEGNTTKENFQSVTTFLIAPGLKYKLKPIGNTLLTFGIDLQYAPYRIKDALHEDIGKLAITPRLLYSF